MTYYQKKSKKDSGAKEGLEKKMKYWEDKDYKMELSVTTGQALNLLFSLPDFDTDINEEEAKKRFKWIFKFMLKTKLDKEVVEMFNKYYAYKKNLTKDK